MTYKDADATFHESEQIQAHLLEQDEAINVAARQDREAGGRSGQALRPAPAPPRTDSLGRSPSRRCHSAAVAAPPGPAPGRYGVVTTQTRQSPVIASGATARVTGGSELPGKLTTTT